VASTDLGAAERARETAGEATEQVRGQATGATSDVADQARDAAQRERINRRSA